MPIEALSGDLNLLSVLDPAELPAQVALGELSLRKADEAVPVV